MKKIEEIAGSQSYNRWIEPFCGSCVVPLNVQPKQALLCDTNIHIIRFYQDIQKGILTSADAKKFLEEEGNLLSEKGGEHYYAVRERFNNNPNSMDFLFLNRSCFNGLMRFNKTGRFNVPFGHKPERFARAYITKITNQIKRISEVILNNDWTFTIADFRQTLSSAKHGDIVYADPPYAGRHVDYFNSWSDADELELTETLKGMPCDFILSTWYGNKFRTNELVAHHWNEPPFHIITHEHFYHVGSSETLRHAMTEALVVNFPMTQPLRVREQFYQLSLL